MSCTRVGRLSQAKLEQLMLLRRREDLTKVCCDIAIDAREEYGDKEYRQEHTEGITIITFSKRYNGMGHDA